jgi:hypothetical protein
MRKEFCPSVLVGHIAGTANLQKHESIFNPGFSELVFDTERISKNKRGGWRVEFDVPSAPFQGHENGRNVPLIVWAFFCSGHAPLTTMFGGSDANVEGEKFRPGWDSSDALALTSVRFTA